MRIQWEECFDVLLTSDEADTLSQEAVDEMLPTLKENLREFALSSGWPIDLVEALDISYDGGILYISCSNDEVAAAIEDLEYGFTTGAPSSVLRGFAERSDKYISDVIAEKAIMYVFEEKVGL